MHKLIKLTQSIATLAVLASAAAQCSAQGLAYYWNSIRPLWEDNLEDGNGQKVRRDAEGLLNRPDVQINPSNYNDLHAKVAILGMAARGAVLDGDWPAAISLLSQASTTAAANYASASESLGYIRKQHETKIAEWREQIKVSEEQVRKLKAMPGLNSDQIQDVMYLESSISEYAKALANSEQSIADIDVILHTLKDEVDTCAKSLNDWNGFLMKERVDIQGVDSIPRYVREKLAQIKEDTARSRFELISYTRRLLKLEPTNEACKQYLSTLLPAPAPPPAPAPKPKPKPKPVPKTQPKPQEEAQPKAPEEAQKDAQKVAPEDAQKKADEDAKKKADEDAKKKADEDAKKKADEDAKKKADEEAKKKADEEAKKKADEEAKKKADDEAKKKAQDGSQNSGSQTEPPKR